MQRSLLFLVDVLTNATAALILIFVVFVTRNQVQAQPPHGDAAALLVVRVGFEHGQDDTLTTLHVGGSAAVVGDIPVGKNGKVERHGRADAEVSRSTELGVPGFVHDPKSKVFLIPCPHTETPYLVKVVLGTILPDQNALEGLVKVTYQLHGVPNRRVICPGCDTSQPLRFEENVKVVLTVTGAPVCQGT